MTASKLYSPRIERAAVLSLLADPQGAKTRVAALTPGAFHELTEGKMFRVIRDTVEAGKLPDPETIGLALHRSDPKAFDRFGKILGAVHKGCPEAFDQHVVELIALQSRRELVALANRARDLAHDLTAPLNGALEDFISLAGGLTADTAEDVSERLFNPDRQPPEIIPVYTLAGVPICTPGNIAALTASAKAGKSAAIGAMVASTMSTAESVDTLGFHSSNQSGLAVIHIDTEQSIDDHWRLVDRALRRAKVNACPPWLRSYCLTGLGAQKIRSTLKRLIDDCRREFRGIHSILIDGAADLVCDVNCPEECNGFVAELHGLAIANDCPIATVIHFNPGSEKVRGHLGSQLERKAETNLILNKEGEITEIYSAKQRRAPILKGKAPRFRYSTEAGMHVSFEGPMVDPTKIEMLRAEVEDVFRERPAMRYSDLKATVMSVVKKGDRTAERRITDYRQAGLIEKSVANLWIFKGK